MGFPAGAEGFDQVVGITESTVFMETMTQSVQGAPRESFNFITCRGQQQGPPQVGGGGQTGGVSDPRGGQVGGVNGANQNQIGGGLGGQGQMGAGGLGGQRGVNTFTAPRVSGLRVDVCLS